ncbi:MAG: ABC transporter ATP-binding protein, partial [Microcella sp.]|nr:ABC transporter ATP-binding protein [Microcella sp.]
EPTAGLDPGSRAIVWSTIHHLREHHGLTVFLTTHYMEETEQADLVSIIDRGTVIAQGTPTHLRAQYSSSVLLVTSRDRPALARLAVAKGLEHREHLEVTEVLVPDAAVARSLLADHGDDVLDFEFRHGRMDDVFLALTGRAREEVAG